MRRELQRLATFVIVILFSICFNFFLPRMMPGNPVSAMISRMSSLGKIYGQQELVEHYLKLFALEGTMWDQFVAYLRELVKGNLGISYSAYPTPVSTLILWSLPYTLGLMLTSTIISWVLGTIIGGIVGWKGEKMKISPVLSFLSIVFANFPYFLLALVFVFLFAYTFPIFPLGGAYSTLLQPSFSLTFIVDVIYHAIGPI
ncbi:MAG: ABC transporter permease, partial [Candidatus Bathyarchaeia archaeon]